MSIILISEYLLSCMQRRLTMRRKDDVRAGEVQALTSQLRQGRMGMVGAEESDQPGMVAQSGKKKKKKKSQRRIRGSKIQTRPAPQLPLNHPAATVISQRVAGRVRMTKEKVKVGERRKKRVRALAKAPAMAVLAKVAGTVGAAKVVVAENPATVKLRPLRRGR